MFAEDIDILPRGLFTETVASAKNNTEKLTRRLKDLFKAMAHGGDFGNRPMLTSRVQCHLLQIKIPTSFSRIGPVESQC